MAKIDLNLNLSGGEGVGKLRREIEELKDELAEAEAHSASLSKELKNLKAGQTKSALEGISKAITSISESQDNLSKNLSKYTKASNDSTKTVVSNFDKQISKLRQMTNAQVVASKEQAKARQRATALLTNTEDELSTNQVSKIERLLTRWENGDINQLDFAKRIDSISKVYSKAYKYKEALAASDKETLAHEEKMAKIERSKNYAVIDEATATAKLNESAQKVAAADERDKKLLDERLAREKAITSEKIKQEQNKTTNQNTKDAAAAEAQQSKAKLAAEKLYNYQEDREKKLEAQEANRQSKLEQNEKARLAVYTKLREVISGTGEVQSATDRRAEVSIKRLKETMQNLQKFAANKGFVGTTGLESSSYLRVQQYSKNIKEAAAEWKKVNSAEGKAADTLSRIIYDVDKFRSGVGMIHTTLGQVASALGAIRGVGQTLRYGLQNILQYSTQLVSQLTSEAFTSSLEALKDLELSEIGFSNFFGEEEVSGILSQVKQEALTSPLSATQLADYVNQLAPLSNGNSTLTIDAAMGIAKMIQYSGGEVSTEMEYVVKNLRDVMSKGTATTVDIRQFNRAMPALEKVLKDMGLTEFLDESESTLTITKENASKMLEVFQKIDSSEDVGDIFNQTSETLSGLMERLEEQIQLIVIDVGDFSGLTDLVKGTLSDLLNDTNGRIADIKMTLQFTFYDIVRWLKSRDWDKIIEDAKEIFNIFKEGISDALYGLKQSIGSKDMANTIKNFTKALTSFLEGMINGYSWLVDMVNGLSNSGVIGSSIGQGIMQIMGFMSSGAGTLITGLTRGLGNAIGVVNQFSLSLRNALVSAQARLSTAAATVSTFGEALAIVTKMMPTLAEDIALINEMYAGNITSEQAASKAKIMAQKAETEASNLVATAKKAEAEASKLATEADTAEAAGSTTATSGGLFSGLFGISGSGKGTKVAGVLTKLLGAFIGGELISTISSSITSGISDGLGSDEYTSKNISSGVGNIAGGIGGGALAGATIGSVVPAIGTAIGAGVGAIVGAIGGIASTVGDIEANQKEQTAAELDAFEEEINSGEYTRQIVENYGHQQLRLTDDEFDTVNSRIVQEMNQFNETFPNGSAEMLKEYLKSIEGELYEEGGTLAVADKEREQQAEELWTLINSGETERANQYAEGLYNIGLSTSDVTSMILEKASEAWKDEEDLADKLKDLVLQWGDVQDESGNDLTYEYIQKMKSGSETDQAVFGNYRNQLQSLYLDMGQDLVANAEGLSTEDKKEISKTFASAMTKWVTDSTEELSADEKASLVRMYTLSNMQDGGKTFGVFMTPEELDQATGYGNSDQLKKWGFNYNWSSYATDTTGKELNEAQEELYQKYKNGEITLKEYYDELEKNTEKYYKTAKEKLQEYAEDFYGESENTIEYEGNIVNNLWNAVTGLFGTLGDAIGDLINGDLSGSISSLINGFVELGASFGSTLSGIVGNVGEFFGAIGTNMGSFFSSALSGVGSFFGDIGTKMGSFFTSSLTSIGSFFGSIGDKFGSMISGLGDAVNNAGSTIGDILNGIGTTVGGIVSGVTGNYNGGLIHKASGGDIRGVDTVPAMLQPGEFVVRRSSVEKFGLTALNALNTGDTGYFARTIARQNVYGDYSNARTWNSTMNDNRKSVTNTIKVYNRSKGARLNRYYSLANRLS